LIQSLRQ